MSTKVRRNRLEAAREACARAKALARKARKAEAELAVVLLEISRRELWKPLGYNSLQTFAEAELEVSGGKAMELVHLAQRLEKLPKAKAAFAAGEVSWTKARQIVRIATVDDEGAWLAKAATATNRGLERAVAEAKGEAPRRYVRFELTLEQYAKYEQAARKLREERKAALTPAEVLEAMAECAVGAPVENPGYQVVIHECPTCAAASRDGGEGPVPVGDAMLAAAHEDAEIVDLRTPEARRRRTIPPALRAKVVARDWGRCRYCGSAAWQHVHHTVPGRGDLDSLILLCSTCHKHLVHRGELVIVPLGEGCFDFRLRDGSPAPMQRRCA